MPPVSCDGEPASYNGEQRALTSREHRRLADILLDAARTRRAIPPLSEAFREMTLADAYGIRDMLLARRISEGDQLIGAKVSLAPAGPERRHMAPDPQLGWLTHRMLVSSGAVDLSRLIHPRVEPRLGFLLARTLHEPVAAGIGLLAATERVLPCLLIVDSRYDGAHPRLVDHIADNCATAGLLVGHGVPPPAEGHLRRVRAQLQADGAVRTPPPRAHAMVPPLEAATWLANRMLRGGNRPEPGTLLVAPIASRPVELLPGLRVTARFEGIGSVDLQALPSSC
jgi:2-keto-4-pentenoate hydratase